MSNPYRIIFMGTPDFAAVQLKTLCENGYRPIAVYTQPDKINGRGNRITFSDVKKLAMEENIPVYQPTTFKSRRYYSGTGCIKARSYYCSGLWKNSSGRSYRCRRLWSD